MQRQSYDHKVYRRLMDAGCPVDAPAAWEGGEICQTGGPGESAILDLGDAIGYLVCLELNVQQPLVVDRFELQLPWRPREFQWLPPLNEQYQFPDNAFPLPQDEVLNGLADRGQVLRPPQHKEGWLLAQSWGPLPPRLRHAQSVPATVWLYDTRGRAAGCPCQLLAANMRARPARPRRPQPSPLDRIATALGVPSGGLMER